MKLTDQLLTFIFLSAMVAGCSYFPDRSLEYQENANSSQLTVPPHFPNAQLGDDLVIPNTNQSVYRRSLLPPESMASEIAEGKLTKKELKKRELQSRMTNLEWTQSQSGSEALITSEEHQDAWNHLDRALQKLSSNYRIKNKDKSLSIFTIYDLSRTQGKLKGTTPLYQIHLNEDENGTLITLTTYGTENAPSPDVNQRILGKLHESLDETKEGLSFKQWLGW